MADKKSKLIFIVEDDKSYAKALEKFIQERFPAISTEVFPVGELAVDNLHRDPDLIIMDYYLNSRYYDAEDGLEIVRQIKAMHANVKTIVLSGQDKLEVVVKAVEETHSHYVMKGDHAFQKIEELIRAMY